MPFLSLFEEEPLKNKPIDYFEKRAYQEGFRLIAGVDEAGRGPLCGPVVAAAVILPLECSIQGINDSKLLSKKQREILFDLICKEAVAIGIGEVDNQEIERINILQASILAMCRAINNLPKKPELILTDALFLPSIPYCQKNIIKGDRKSISIAAASIIAKVKRDRIMEEYDKLFPCYNWKKNKGYPTRAHLEAIKKYGPTYLHRKTFKGVKEYYSNL